MTLREALVDTLEWLMLVARDGAGPDAASERFRDLRRRHPGTGMELVWEQEAYGGSTHYDVLLDRQEGGTVCLSFCPDQAVPWPLRGVHRWSEADLARVNQRVLKVDQAVACLDFIWDEAPLVERLIDVCLLQEALEQEPVELSDEELQDTMDTFRRARRLYTAAETRDWMERHGVTHEKLERLVADHARVRRLRERLTAGKVEPYFEEHRPEFDTARIARLDFPDEESASRAALEIRAGALAFYEAAERCFLEQPEAPGPFFERLRRGEASPALAAAVFAADPGQVVGPVRVGEGFTLARVVSIAPARLDDRTRRAIRQILFQEWLAGRRQAAVVEWYWGNAARTARAA